MAKKAKTKTKRPASRPESRTRAEALAQAKALLRAMLELYDLDRGDAGVWGEREWLAVRMEGPNLAQVAARLSIRPGYAFRDFIEPLRDALLGYSPDDDLLDLWEPNMLGRMGGSRKRMKDMLDADQAHFADVAARLDADDIARAAGAFAARSKSLGIAEYDEEEAEERRNGGRVDLSLTMNGGDSTDE